MFKNKFTLFALLFLSCHYCLQAAEEEYPERYAEPEAIARELQHSSEISEHIWGRITPHLLPEDHPIKAKLDQIFGSVRAIHNRDSLRKAGFTNVNPRKVTRLIVSSHPKLKGYIVKMYTDKQGYYKKMPEYHWWLERIKGAEMIRQEIAANQWEHWFKVPKKWIYALPVAPAPEAVARAKYFILVEEDMHILGDTMNRKAWKNSSPDVVEALFHIVTKLGLKDCAKPDNVPFCKDGKVAFVDTQTYDERPIRYSKMTSCLSKQNKARWKYLIDNHKD